MFQTERSNTSSDKEESIYQENDFNTKSNMSFTSESDGFSQLNVSQETDVCSSSAEILKCLNRGVCELLPLDNVGRGNDRNAIIRLNGELLRSQKSNWSVLDALVKSYSEIRELRVKEQKLNLALSSTAKISDFNSKSGSIQLKVLETQLIITKEELVKIKTELNDLKVEKGKLLSKLFQKESEYKLLFLENKRKDDEIERLRIGLKLARNKIGQKNDKISNFEDIIVLLREDVQEKDQETFKLKKENYLLQDATMEQEREIERIRLEKYGKASDVKYGKQQKYYGSEIQDFQEAKTEQIRNDDEIQLLTAERDRKIEEIIKLKQDLRQWERYGARVAKEMNEYIDETNKRQQEAKQEIFRYVTQLEQELQQVSAASLQMKHVRMPDPDEGMLRNTTAFTEPRKNYRTHGSNGYKQQTKAYQPQVKDSSFQKVALAKNKTHRGAKPGKKLSDVKIASRPRCCAKNDTSSSYSLNSQTENGCCESDISQRANSPVIEANRKISKGSRRKLPLAPSDVVPKLQPSKAPPGVKSMYDGHKKPNTYHQKRQISNASVIGHNGLCCLSDLSKVNELTLEGSHCSQKVRLSSFCRKLSASFKRGRAHVKPPVPPQPEHVHSNSDSFHTVTPLSESESVASSSPHGGTSTDTQQHERKRNTKVPYSRRVSRNRLSVVQRMINTREQEALILIFSYLNPLERCGVARVCRAWKEASENPRLWSRVVLSNIFVNNLALKSVSQRCHFLKHLKLKGLKKIPSELSATNNMTSENCYLERGLEYITKAAAGNLLTVHIENCGALLTDRSLFLVASHCRNLVEVTYISASYPACPESLWSLWSCRNIISLHLPPMFHCDHPSRFNDRSLETIGNCWPNLRQLTIGGPCITPTGLAHIAKGCLRLQYLELDRMVVFTEETAQALCLNGLKGLEAIVFTFTPVTDGAVKQLFGACPRLEHIAIHIGISDFFSDVNDPEHIREYQTIITRLQSLKTNAELARILHIKADYG